MLPVKTPALVLSDFSVASTRINILSYLILSYYIYIKRISAATAAAAAVVASPEKSVFPGKSVSPEKCVSPGNLLHQNLF